jgi:hypothetical protein
VSSPSLIPMSNTKFDAIIASLATVSLVTPCVY